mgnify:CR=1 FL=1
MRQQGEAGAVGVEAQTGPLGLAGLLILLGVYPQPFLDTSAATMSGVQQWLGTAFTQLASAR